MPRSGQKAIERLPAKPKSSKDLSVASLNFVVQLVKLVCGSEAGTRSSHCNPGDWRVFRGKLSGGSTPPHEICDHNRRLNDRSCGEASHDPAASPQARVLRTLHDASAVSQHSD